MAKQLSTHAAAAKMIRQHLKAIGVTGKVKRLLILWDLLFVWK